MLSFSELQTSFDYFFDQNLPFPQDPSGLYKPCRYILNVKGKRIRPVLSLIAAQMFQKEIPTDVYRTAMALELFHNFTLIHDDIMDNAPLRRGKQTIHEKYGLTSGILSGDVMNIFSYQCLTALDTKYLKEILSLFNQTAIEVCEGQQLDMDFETMKNVEIENYIEMIRLKTSVLLACSLKAGGIIAGATEADTQRLYEIGINMGLAFQLQDDLLDSFGNSSQTGKTVGGDIKANKKTYLLLKAQKLANPSQQEQILDLLTSNKESKVSQMIQIMKDLKVDQSCSDMINHYYQKALTDINLLNASQDAKSPLLGILDSLQSRKH